MKNLIVSTFLIIVTGLSFIDSRDDASKTILVIDYDNGTQDKLVIDKKLIKSYNKYILWTAVQQILDKKENNK